MSNIHLYDNDAGRAVTVTFPSRRPLTPEMDVAVLRLAYDGSYALVNHAIEMGLEMPVWLVPADKRCAAGYRQLAKHVVVTNVGDKDIIVYLVPGLAGWYHGIVCDGAELEVFIRSRMGYTATGSKLVLAYDTLYCDLSGDYAGAVVDGYDLTVYANEGWTSPLQRPRYINEAEGANELPEAIVEKLDADFMVDFMARMARIKSTETA